MSPGDADGGRSEGDAGSASAVETLLYAPIGLVLEGRNLLPRLVERGRNHVAMARLIGEFAVRKGTEDLVAGAAGAQERLLGALGRGPATVAEPGGEPPPGRADQRDEGGVPPAASPPPAARVAPAAAAAAADIDPANLPIPDYDLLSASQVVPRLESLGEDELALVARYEAGTRGRRTILAKVAQLRTGPPG